MEVIKVIALVFISEDMLKYVHDINAVKEIA